MFEWIHKTKNQEINITDLIIDNKANYLFICELAMDKAIGMIAKMIAKSEFKVFRNNEQKRIVETKNNLYYRLNIKPNDYETGTDFWKHAIKKLLRDGECLIIADAFQKGDGKLYVADSFMESNEVLYPRRYTNVCVEDYEFRKTFIADDVLHLKNKNRRILSFMNRFNKAYADLLATAFRTYRISNATKFRIDIPGTLKIKKENGDVITGNAYAQEIASKIASEELEVIIANGNMPLNKIDIGTPKNPSDIKELTIHIFEMVAFIFDIPLDVFVGKTTEKSNAMNDFITFAVSDIVEIINDSLNAKWVSQEEFLLGEKIEIDQSSFKHVDILDVSTSLDKLFADGFSHNDLRGFVGLTRLDEDWADEHHVTKNYATAKGGEAHEEIL